MTDAIARLFRAGESPPEAHVQLSLGLRSLQLVEERTERQRRFAFALGWALREKAWSAAELARAVGVSNSTTLRWIAGTHVPDILTTKELAKALGVKPEFLFDPPAVPPYPFDEYLVSEATAAGTEEGIQKSRRRPRRAAGGES